MNKKKKTMLNCEQCGKVIMGYGKRFCSYKCRGRWTSANHQGENNPNWKGGKVKLSCEQCGEEFEVAPSKAGRGEKRFCSRICFGKFVCKKMSGKSHPNWKEKIKKICEWCGEEFEAIPSLTHQKFCSRKCFMVSWMVSKRIKEICLWCGKGFEAHPSEHRKFCCQKCMGLWRSTYFLGEKAPNWQGGISWEPYGEAFNDTLKRKIRKRDNHTCAISGEVWKEGQDKFPVHHINYCKTDNLTGNLITLCIKCHGKTNANRKHWQALLTPVAEMRAIGERA